MSHPKNTHHPSLMNMPVENPQTALQKFELVFGTNEWSTASADKSEGETSGCFEIWMCGRMEHAPMHI